MLIVQFNHQKTESVIFSNEGSQIMEQKKKKKNIFSLIPIDVSKHQTLESICCRKKQKYLPPKEHDAFSI